MTKISEKLIFLPQNLRFLREAKGLTQVQLAEKIGVKPNTISNYETGNSSPDFGLLEALVNILEVDAHSLLFEDMRVRDRGVTRRVSDVRMPYGTEARDSAGNAADDADRLRDYERQLEKMREDIEALKKLVAGQSGRCEP